MSVDCLKFINITDNCDFKENKKKHQFPTHSYCQTVVFDKFTLSIKRLNERRIFKRDKYSLGLKSSSSYLLHL